jgi:uncharacterized protein DUF3224
MKKTTNARFSIKSWDEKPYSEGKDLPKMTRASVDKTFTGDIDGERHVEYVMMYRSDGTAAFVGLERITGRLAGRNGSFVLESHLAPHLAHLLSQVRDAAQLPLRGVCRCCT